MALLKPQTDRLNRERYFKEPKTGIVYRRISGGLAWPELDKPGALCVLGETRGKQNYYGNRHYDVHVLEEVRTSSTSALIDNMARMTADWYVPRWAVAMHDLRRYLLDDMNDELKRLRVPKIVYGDPHGLQGKGEGQMKFYHAFAEVRTLDEKTLFFHGATAADEIRQMDDHAGDSGRSDGERKPTDFPAAAALLFALAEFDVVRMPDAVEAPEYEFGANDYDGGY